MEEVEQLCTRIAIIDKGKNIAIGTKDELKKMIHNTETIKIEVMQLTDDAMKKIKALKHVYDAALEDGQLTVKCSGGSHNLIEILGILKECDIALGRIYSEQPTLNDVFLEITGKELRDTEGQ